MSATDSPLKPMSKQERDRAVATHGIASARHLVKGLELLAEHFRIPNDTPSVSKYGLIAICLAERHVPYFQQPGRKRGVKREVGRYALLEIDIELERQAGARSDRAALTTLCLSKQPWKGNDPDSLERLLRKARKSDPVSGLIRNGIESIRRDRGPLKAYLREMRTIFSAK